MEFSKLQLDKHNKYVYYDAKSKKYFLVKPNLVRQVNAFVNRYFVALAAAILITWIFNLNYMIAILIFVGAAIFLEWFFRAKLIPRLIYLKKYNPDDLLIKNRHSKAFIVFKLIVYVVVALLLILLVIFMPSDRNTNLISILFSIVSFGLGYHSYFQLQQENKRLSKQ